MSSNHETRRPAYAHALAALLPRGEVWPREDGTMLARVVRAIAGLPARWAAGAWHFLAVESYPPSSDLTLADWERVLGLPEPCLPVVGMTVPERQAAVREKLARRPGRQDRQYFIDIAARLGYPDITITEYVPFQCGVTPCGAHLRSSANGQLIVRGAGLGSPEIRFVWRITVGGPRLTWFACGASGGRCGDDPHLRIRRAEDLECVLRALAPAHTKLIFAYQGV